MFKIFFRKIIVAFSRCPTDPQDVLDAQMRREAARRIVDSLLR